MSCCDWQKQQYFSQVHSFSGLSHCEHRVITAAFLPLHGEHRPVVLPAIVGYVQVAHKKLRRGKFVGKVMTGFDSP
jgi:hypothetical protein